MYQPLNMRHSIVCTATAGLLALGAAHDVETVTETETAVATPSYAEYCPLFTMKYVFTTLEFVGSRNLLTWRAEYHPQGASLSLAHVLFGFGSGTTLTKTLCRTPYWGSQQLNQSVSLRSSGAQSLGCAISLALAEFTFNTNWLKEMSKVDTAIDLEDYLPTSIGRGKDQDRPGEVKPFGAAFDRSVLGIWDQLMFMSAAAILSRLV